MTTIADMIYTYGIVPVLFAAIIFVSVFLIKKQQKSLEEQQKSNAAQEKRITKLYETLLKINNHIEPKHSVQEEEENRKINLLIDQQIQKLLNQTGSNRVSCFLYHNGGKDVAGRSFQKMSMTHEVVDSNTVPVMTSYQNVPRMMFPSLIQHLSEEGYYYIENIEDIRETAATSYQSFYARGTKSAFIRSIRTTEGLVLGFVCVEFSTSSPADLEQLKENLLNKVVKISGALEINQPIIDKKGEV